MVLVPPARLGLAPPVSKTGALSVALRGLSYILCEKPCKSKKLSFVYFTRSAGNSKTYLNVWKEDFLVDESLIVLLV